MKLIQYKVPIHIAYDQNGVKNQSDGHQIVFADDPAKAQKIAKARSLESLKRQGVKIIFFDLKDPVEIPVV